MRTMDEVSGMNENESHRYIAQVMLLMASAFYARDEQGWQQKDLCFFQHIMVLRHPSPGSCEHATAASATMMSKHRT